MINALMEKYRKFPKQVKASFWFVVCGFLQKAISLLTTPIFSRLLSTSDYGVFSVFTTWENIIIIIASLNLASGVYLRGLIKFEDDKDEFTASLQCLYTINTFAVFLIYVLFSSFWSRLFDLPFRYVCLMFVDILVTVAFHFWSARQRVDFLYKALVGVTLLNAILKPGLGILGVLLCADKIQARIYTMVLADVLVFGYFFIDTFRTRGLRISTKYWKYALNYNLPLVPHYLSQTVLNQSDRIMINSIVGASAAGIYSLAYSASVILTIVNQSVLNSYNPWMYKKIRDKEYDSIGEVSVMLLILIGVLNLFLIAFAPEAIAILAPPAYYEAIWVIPPVSMSVFFMFMYSLFANFEFYYEKTKLMMVASVSGAALNIFLNSVFIQKYGFLAAGYTTLVCYLCYCVFHYIIMRQIIKKELHGLPIYNIRMILLLSVLFVGAGFLFMAFYEHTLIRYGLIVVMLLICLWKKDAIIGTLRRLKLEKK